MTDCALCNLFNNNRSTDPNDKTNNFNDSVVLYASDIFSVTVMSRNVDYLNKTVRQRKIGFVKQKANIISYKSAKKRTIIGCNAMR